MPILKFNITQEAYDMFLRFNPLQKQEFRQTMRQIIEGYFDKDLKEREKAEKFVEGILNSTEWRYQV